MKRIYAVLLIVSILVSLTACRREPTVSEPGQTLLGQTQSQTQKVTDPDGTEEIIEESIPEETVEYPEETVSDEVIEIPDETVPDDPLEDTPAIDTSDETAISTQSVVAQPLTWSKLNAIPIANANMTEDQLRQICVDFMRLQLSFAWTPSEDMVYTTGGTTVTLYAGTAYGGLPYVSSTFGNLYKAMEYYDETTGTLKVQANIAKVIGNQCSASAYWAWSRVSNAISYGGTSNMLEKNGCLRIGSYTYDSSIESFHNESIRTANICTANGEQTMYEAYAQLLPADGISMYTGGAGHVRMVAETAHVIRNADGTINGERSSITFLDQVDSWKSDMQSNGQPIRIQGGVDVTVSFASLYKAGYLPFRIPELAGKDPVEEATASIGYSSGAVSVQALQGSTLSANYPLSDITVTVTDQSGKQVYSHTKPLSGLNIYSYMLSSAMETYTLSSFANGTCKVSVTCRVGTGEKLTAYSGILTQ